MLCLFSELNFILFQLVACFNSILKKDEAIQASTSSSGVEEAFAGLTQSLKESRQKYEEDKVSWENKFKSSELALQQANTALTLAEQSSKAVTTKLEEAERRKTVLEEKLKSAEELDAKLKEAERRKGELEEKLKSSEELLRKEISLGIAKKRAAAKKYFSAGWEQRVEQSLECLVFPNGVCTSKILQGWMGFSFEEVECG